MTHLRSEGSDEPLDRLLSTTAEQLIVASNRQPYRHDYGEDDEEITVDRPTGGLAAGLDSAMRQTDGTWIAWGDGEADEQVVDGDDRVEVPPEEDRTYTLERLWIDDDEIEGYYGRISNRLLWPICHAALTNAESCGDAWADYRSVNEQFADALADAAGDGDVVWLQDYHLALAPRLVRERTAEPFLAHSWHIPWPAWDTFRACPHGEDLLDGLLGNDLLGFHVPRYCENFLESVDEGLPDAEVDHETGEIAYRGETTTVRAFPMGVPVERIREQATGPKAAGFWAAFRRKHRLEDARIAVGVDRLDYTKGIVQRLDALEYFWENHPEWRGELTYVQVGSVSRSTIPAYRQYRQDVEERVEGINERFGTDDWQPIVYTTKKLANESLAGLYRQADVALVSPIRDGMNLVAQEYVAAQDEDGGVLVLSDQAGAHDELGEWTLSIKPHDTPGFAGAIERALTMPAAERRRRTAALREVVTDADIEAWLRSVLADVRSLKGADGESVTRVER